MCQKSDESGSETEQMLPIRPLQHKLHFSAPSHQVKRIQFTENVCVCEGGGGGGAKYIESTKVKFMLSAFITGKKKKLWK